MRMTDLRQCRMVCLSSGQSLKIGAQTHRTLKIHRYPTLARRTSYVADRHLQVVDVKCLFLRITREFENVFNQTNGLEQST